MESRLHCNDKNRLPLYNNYLINIIAENDCLAFAQLAISSYNVGLKGGKLNNLIWHFFYLHYLLFISSNINVAFRPCTVLIAFLGSDPVNSALALKATYP